MFVPFDDMKKITENEMNNIIKDKGLEPKDIITEWQETDVKHPENEYLKINWVEVTKNLFGGESYLLKYSKSWVLNIKLLVYTKDNVRHLFAEVERHEENEDGEEEYSGTIDQYILYTSINMDNI